MNMKKLTWLAGLLLVLSFVFPNGVPLPKPPVNPPAPAPSPVEPVDGSTNAAIVALLKDADPADKARVAGIYAAMRDVLKRDAGKLVTTTEQWSLWQANTLKAATDGTQLKGKYPGLDVAIEAVFESKLGKDKTVVPADPAVRSKIDEACAIVVASALAR